MLLLNEQTERQLDKQTNATNNIINLSYFEGIISNSF